MSKEKINRLVHELSNYDLEVIKKIIAKKIVDWNLEDYESLEQKYKIEIHYLYDVHYLAYEAKHKAEYNRWIAEWVKEELPERNKISGKYLVK